MSEESYSDSQDGTGSAEMLSIAEEPDEAGNLQPTHFNLVKKVQHNRFNILKLT